MKIYCCGCEKYVPPRLTTGREIYPHLENLHKLNFYKCNICNNYVGTHKNSVNKIDFNNRMKLQKNLPKEIRNSDRVK